MLDSGLFAWHLAGMREETGNAGRRLVWAVVVAVALVVGAVTLPSYAGDRQGSLQAQMTAQKKKQLEARPHVDPPGTPPHNHNDPKTKNSVSRAGETGKDVRDPSTFVTRAVAKVGGRRGPEDEGPAADQGPGDAAAAQAPPGPLRDGQRLLQPRRDERSTSSRPTSVSTSSTRPTGSSWSTAARPPRPSDATIWTARAGASTATRSPTPASRWWSKGKQTFRLKRAKGCTAYPEAGVNISGRPHGGVTPYQEVRGYVDAHTHGMAFEFLGGDAHCGKPWDRFGAPYALVDCPDHTATGGYGGALEDVLSGEPCHDPVGWPTFKDWPAPESLTHEGTYYKWLERSWRGGQRIFVNLLVENNQLCQLYPIKHNSCDDMDSVRLQAQDMYEMQDYIDAQFGGPGKGFYRIVKNPFQARKVINAGKMAVVMGIETSVPFGCTMKLDVPACSIADIDQQLDEVRKLGVRQMELVNKFDNALSGVAGDNGAVGIAVNAANFLETGSFWDMQHCAPADGESHDRNQVAAPDISAGQQDALFGAIACWGCPTWRCRSTRRRTTATRAA